MKNIYISENTPGFIRQSMSQSGKEFLEFQMLDNEVVVRLEYYGNHLFDDNESYAFGRFLRVAFKNGYETR